MQFRTSQYQVLIFVLLLVDVGATRQVIRAAPGIETTGQYMIKYLDNVEFVEEETFVKASLSWALDRIDQVSPILDGIFEPGRNGKGVDIYIRYRLTVLTVFRVITCIDSTPLSIIVDGLNFAATNITNESSSSTIISMSLGGPFNHLLNNMSNNIVNMGIPIVVAAGNERGDACYYSPASASEVITVAGSAQGDDVYYYTNGGSCVDIFAPAIM
ncbi:LOW QUALITY PROTEIN: alkaline protease 1-like [Gigantopelta aegis]|uniref:LOW QUALITY PROTEIN: alkaline protease 1-like n=1 Tax=Gigantopelta aegis TaxID=1735272 RepID=UPI001B8883D3|nr:LOW QUALITY PROTEIN: alkaline protease 1-like [Gigantopelta aegis]